MPLSDLAAALWPPPESEVLAAANQLRYRSILTVNLVVRKADIAPDNWIYLHDARVRAGRLQLYKNWSPDLVPEAGKSTVGLEYFINEGGVLWRSDDQRLVDLAKRDLKRIGLVGSELVEDGFVVRYAKAYPVYDLAYREHVGILRRCVGRLANLVCVGRYGQFRYNNMDHSILSALLGVRRLLGEGADPWSVNAEAQYHQEAYAQGPVGPVPAATA